MQKVGEKVVKFENENSMEKNKKISAKLKNQTLTMLSPFGILLAWEIMSRTNLLDSIFFPAPSTILVTMLEMIESGVLLTDLKVSLIRIFGGFFLGAIPGLIIGLTMGLFPIVKIILDPIVNATYPIPKLAIMPLIMILLGLTEFEKMVIIALGVIYMVLLNTVAGVVNLDKIYLDVAKNYGASKKDYYLTVAFPGALPMIFTGLKLGMGMALLLIVASEMNGASQGIGYRIWASYAIFNIPEMFVCFIMMAILGYIFTAVLDRLERIIIPWKQV